MADLDETEPSNAPAFTRQLSVFDESDVKLSSVWATIKNKPSPQDIMLAQQEAELYDGQLLPSRSEILGWYLYDWANSPMFNVLVGLIMPIFLSSLALQYGCIHEAKYGCNVNNEAIEEDIDIKVYMGSWQVKPTAFVQLMIGFSGAIQAVIYIAIGALADYSSFQYYGFQICTLIASLMIFVFFFLDEPGSFLFAGWWFAIQLCFLGLALIFYNAYLPLIVENHWIVRRVIRHKRPTQQICKVKQQLADDMSQYGVACGYCGSLLMTMIATMVLFMTQTTQYQILTGFASNTGTPYDEQWLRPVHRVSMRFDDTHLVQIQLAYHDITIDGALYGLQTTSTSATLQVYNIPQETDYITTIHFWTNTADKSINSLQFITQNGNVSEIYSATNSTNIERRTPDEIAVANDFIFAGYKVFIEQDKIMGMDLVMLNQETGQFQSTIGFRMIALLVFIWWNVFQLITIKYLKRRDGPPLPPNSNAFTFSSIQTYRALRSASDYPHLFRYLLAWFCFSDGLNTLSVTAVLFATTVLNFSQTEAGILFLEALLLGSVGGGFFLWLQRLLLWDSKQMLLLHIIFYLCLCLYAFIGLIPNVPFGLVTKTELYIYVFFYGLNWGSIQSYARSVYTYLVPIGKEAQMFSLYEITDKGSSWIGPIMVAIITNHANIRWGLFYVTTFFAVAAPILYWGVDLKQGMQQAGRWKEDTETEEEDVDTETIKYKDTENNNDDDDDGESNTDNYNEPKIKIKVTSIDDDEEEVEMKKNEKSEDETEM